VKRQVRRLGVALLVLYGALFVQLNVVQVLRAEEYNENPANTRAVLRDFGRARGQIVSADGTVLARSVPDDGPFERRREYPEGVLFGHVTGFFSFTYGADGVEKTYNEQLAGRQASGDLRNFAELLLDDEVTNDVVLSLDKRVQEVARNELGERRGSVVALDPRDGSVIAMWSFPSYDPTILSVPTRDDAEAARQLLLAAEGNPLLARAFRETYFPGSTFKVVTAAAGVASGKVTPESPDYPVEREFVPPQTTSPIRNFGEATCGGTLIEILRVSCNTAFARMGVETLTAEELVGQAEAFGFNDRPPLDLPAVAASRIEPVDFFDQNLPLLGQTAIGQNTVRATPLQMALVAAGIANGGQVMRPHVLGEVRSEEGRVVHRPAPEMWTRATSPQVAALIRDAMIVTATEGTARALQVPGVTTAGKTGTAQRGDGTSHAWIIGFAPAEAPRVAVAVIVEGQPGASEQTGGRVAAPIGRAVLEAALQVVAEQ
jgi:peptidoglycan glycosyltransferase